MDWNTPWEPPADPTAPARYRYLYALSPTVVWAKQLPNGWWQVWNEQGSQDMRDQCFRDRYRLAQPVA